MGIIYTETPQFLIGNEKATCHKLMFLRKNGKAVHKLGDMTNDSFAELICISNENETEWIGNFAEGFGLFDVHFAKTDCKEATDEEIEMWIANHASIIF